MNEYEGPNLGAVLEWKQKIGPTKIRGGTKSKVGPWLELLLSLIHKKNEPFDSLLTQLAILEWSTGSIQTESTKQLLQIE